MRTKNIIVMGIIMIISINCSSNSGSVNLTPSANKNTLGEAPEWYANPPFKEGYLYGSASATSRDLQTAVDKATLEAQTNLGLSLKSEISGLVKRVKEETGLEDDSRFLDQFSRTQEQVISLGLENLKTIKRDIQQERTDGGKKLYRAYVLVEYNENAATEKILNQIKQDQALYDAIRATELIEEMEEKVNAYRERTR